MYDNYHSKYILYPVLQEHIIIQYLKDHKLKTIIQKIINILKPLQHILLKIDLFKDKQKLTNTLRLTLIYNMEHLKKYMLKPYIKQVKTVIYSMKTVIYTFDVIAMDNERFNILRGFN